MSECMKFQIKCIPVQKSGHKKPAISGRLYQKREKYEKNLSNNCFLLFDGFILQQVCEQAVSEE